MECTSIKFELFWRKISRKDGCKGVSETAPYLREFLCAAFRFRDYIMSSRVIQLFSNRCFILAANASDFASVGLSAYGYRDFDLEDVILDSVNDAFIDAHFIGKSIGL